MLSRTRRTFASPPSLPCSISRLPRKKEVAFSLPRHRQHKQVARHDGRRRGGEGRSKNEPEYTCSLHLCALRWLSRVGVGRPSRPKTAAGTVCPSDGRTALFGFAFSTGERLKWIDSGGGESLIDADDDHRFVVKSVMLSCPHF